MFVTNMNIQRTKKKEKKINDKRKRWKWFFYISYSFSISPPFASIRKEWESKNRICAMQTYKYTMYKYVYVYIHACYMLLTTDLTHSSYGLVNDRRSDHTYNLRAISHKRTFNSFLCCWLIFNFKEQIIQSVNQTWIKSFVFYSLFFQL